MKAPLKIAITGTTGQLAYHAIFHLANGEAFGKDQPLILHLYDLPQLEGALEGVAMEIDDCGFPLVQKVKYGSHLEEIFDDIDVALFIGAKPRQKGMERGDLLVQNGKIFQEQGKALEKRAKRECLVLVVGNPCNTNALLAMHYAKGLKRENFHALMRLDQNRASSLLAKKAGVAIDAVKGVIIWGNHSSTQVPDYTHVKILGKPYNQVLQEEEWLQGAFIEEVQKRGGKIIEKLGRSSAASAGKAAVDALSSLWIPTPSGEFFSSAIWTKGNPYGIAENILFGLPCRSLGRGKVEVVAHLPLTDFIREKMLISQQELLAERDACAKEGLLS